MIDVASGRTLMDKTPLSTRQLVTSMATNTQQFGFRGVLKGVNELATSSGVGVVSNTNNQRLENKLNELTTMVRHLAISQ
uniref:Uncharacterized protein n=1 Tax=Cajanus cajan TaxID=3821 RepID=A0A151SI47_CAJCA|nr:hypothetical protein KK1_000658 [Cajanus cajan]